MNGSDVARVTRWILGTFSRRKLIAYLAIVFGGLPRAIAAAQISQLACGVSGDVCTLLHGCCDGLTCATSRINTNYGVCVAGQGGTMAVTDSVIAPGDRATAEHVAALAANADTNSSDATTTDAEAERQARIQEKKARLAERKDRKHDADVRRRTNQEEQRDRRRENRRRDSPSESTPTDSINQSPDLELTLFNVGGVGGTETLVVTNRSTSNAVLNGIASMAEYQRGDMSMLVEGVIPPLVPDSSFSFLSIPDFLNASQAGWRDEPVCSASDPNDGFVLRAAFTPNSINTDYYVLCDDPATV
jgi:hypothetical protein